MTYWKGWVKGVSFQPTKISIVATLNTLALSRYGLMIKYSRRCAVPLYSARCTVSKTDSDFYRDGTITAINGPYIEAAIFATKSDGWFYGGIFKEDTGLALQKIMGHNGNRIRMSRTVPGLSVGDTFRAWTGCNHSRTECRNVFSNELNYQGFPWLPNKNPMAGDAID